MISFIVCLLPALLATSAQAVNLNCNLCSGTVASCQASTQTCPVDKAKGGCITVAEENTLAGGTKTTGFTRDCLNDYNIGIKGPVTITLGNGKYLRINTTRCNDTDKCNSALLEAPKGNTTQNGLQCPTCFALNVTSCNSQITPCTGEETYCIDFTGTIQRGISSPISTFAAKGCATESTKEITNGTLLDSALSTYNLTKATSKSAEKTPPSGASPALGQFSFALYLPGLTGLLLVKLLA